MQIWWTDGYTAKMGGPVGTFDAVQTSRGFVSGELLYRAVLDQRGSAPVHASVASGQSLALGPEVCNRDGIRLGDDLVIERATLKTDDRDAMWFVVEEEGDSAGVILLCNSFQGFEGKSWVTGPDFAIASCRAQGAQGYNAQSIIDGRCEWCGIAYPSPQLPREYTGTAPLRIHPPEGQVIQWETLPLEVLFAGRFGEHRFSRSYGEPLDGLVLRIEKPTAFRVAYRGQTRQEPGCSFRSSRAAAWNAERYVRWDGSILRIGSRSEIFPDEELGDKADALLKLKDAPRGQLSDLDWYRERGRATDALGRHSAPEAEQQTA